MSRRWPRSIRISPAPPFPTTPTCSRAWSRWSSRLDIGLHLDRFRVQPRGRFDRVATQALDRRTQHRAVYFVWDWLEAIGAGEPFDHAAGMAKLQAQFNRSPYGGPDHLRAAARRRRARHPHRLSARRGPDAVRLRPAAGARRLDHLLDRQPARFRLHHPQGRLQGVPRPAGLPGAQGRRGDQARRRPWPRPRRSAVRWRSSRWTATRGSASPPMSATPDELRAAFARAGGGDGAEIIVETSLAGSDFRLLCVNGRFVAGARAAPALGRGRRRRRPSTS